MIKETFTCCEGSCGRSFRICVWCWPHLRTSESAVSVEKLQCKACWHRTGDLCVSCGRCKGRAHLNKFRRCAKCFKQSREEYCFTCHHCNVTDDTDTEGISAKRSFIKYSCGAAGCETVFYLCRDCVYWFGIAADKFFGMLECKRCWHKSGDLCIYFGDRKAPRNRDAFRYCKQCIANTFCSTGVEGNIDWSHLFSCHMCKQTVLDERCILTEQHIQLKRRFAKRELDKRKFS